MALVDGDDLLRVLQRIEDALGAKPAPAGSPVATAPTGSVSDVLTFGLDQLRADVRQSNALLLLMLAALGNLAGSHDDGSLPLGS